MKNLSSYNQINSKIASNIKKHVQICGLTQSDIVAKMNRLGAKVNQGQISKWCSGLNSPRIDKAEILAKVIGCSLEDFFKI